MSDSSGLPKNDKREAFSQELLSGFIDGELTQEEELRVSRLIASDKLLQNELIELQNAGRSLNAHLADTSANLNLWKELEGRLSPKVPVETRSVAAVSRLKSKPSFFQQIFRPSYGAALAFGLFAVGMLSSEWVELPNPKASNISLSKVKQTDIVSSNNKEILVPLLPNGNKQHSLGQTFVSNGGNSSLRDPAGSSFNYSPQFISPQQLRNGLRSPGVRTGGVEIEWMKNPKKVQIVRHRNESVPPVLWIGELRR